MAVRSNVGAHFPSPNHCGESYRQEDIENHRDICRLEEVAGEFSDVGCKQVRMRKTGGTCSMKYPTTSFFSGISSHWYTATATTSPSPVERKTGGRESEAK